MGSQPNIRKITWWEPYRSSVRASFADLATTGVLRPRFWVRVMTISLVVVAAIAAVILWTHPGITLPWLQLAVGTMIAPAFIAFPVALNVLAPRHIDVRREWIQFTQGQTAVRVKGEQIDSVTVEGDSPARLVIAYRTRKGRQHTLWAHVGRNVDRAVLAAMLEDLSDVRNRRVSSPAAAPVTR